MQSLAWEGAAGLPPKDRIAAAHVLLVELGLDSMKIAEVYARLLVLPEFIIAAGRVAEHLQRAGSPERAALSLEECVDQLIRTRGDASALFVDEILRLVIELCGASMLASRLFGADPMLAIELGARFDPFRSRVDFHDAMQRILTAAKDDTERFDRQIRRYRHRQMLRIALREIRGADVRETSAEIADLASAALQACSSHHEARLFEQFGQADSPCAYVIMGMGKLGGRELNFSSDVDLIFMYEHDEGMVGELTRHQFHVKLVERMIASMSRLTEHGFVFRVDMNLRPEGRKGPLANSLVSAERYYETFGRTWERAAWVRARPVAGDRALGDRVLEMIRPFVWRRSFDLKAIEEIVGMKEKIDASRSRASMSELHRGLDLKLGVGGIREIEFFVQAQQLLFGGKNPRLRSPNTLEALQRLEAAGLVNAKTREVLGNAYLLLRKVEHRVQIVDDRQTHTLPEDPDAIGSLARSLDFGAGPTLRATIEQEMGAVNRVFLSVVGVATDEEAIPTDVDAALDDALDDERRAEAIARLGAQHPYEGLGNLQAAARLVGSPFHPRASGPTARLGRRFFYDLVRSPSFDRALKHLPDLIRTLVFHRSHLEQLERPELRRGVARVLGASDLLSRILVTSPSLLSQVLSPSTLRPLEGFENEVRARVKSAGEDVEEAMMVLRTIKQEETLRTAMADLADLVDTATVGHRLSAVASVLIENALRLAMAAMIERYGAPVCADGRPAEVAIVAGGTLGAMEMGYRTDVDLTVIYVGDGETTGGPRGAVSCGEFFTRAVQRLLQFLTLRTPLGDLYPVDMRLRPSGSQGPLVASLSAFENYHRSAAQLWERQALVRMRTVAGDSALRQQVDRAIEAATYEPGPREDAAVSIRQMADRIERERSSASQLEAVIDLKHGAGGLIELEFVVQFLLLELGHQRTELRTPSTREALRTLGKTRILPREVSEALIEAYDHLRRVQNWLRVMHDEMVDLVRLDRPLALRSLALAVGYQGEDAERHLVRDLESNRALVHQVFEEQLPAVPPP